MTGKFRKVASHSAPEPAFGLFLNLPEGSAPGTLARQWRKYSCEMSTGHSCGTLKTINKRTNTHGAMRNCIEYVLRQDKTNELFTCVTGPYCHDEINYDLVYRTFLEEKKVWDRNRMLPVY